MKSKVKFTAYYITEEIGQVHTLVKELEIPEHRVQEVKDSVFKDCPEVFFISHQILTNDSLTASPSSGNISS